MPAVSGQKVKRCLQGAVEGAHGMPSSAAWLWGDVQAWTESRGEAGVMGRTVSKHLSRSWWRRGIHRYNLFFSGYSEMHGAGEVFWAHVFMLCLSAASNQPRAWESSLKYEKVLSYHCLFSHATRKRRVRLRKSGMLWAPVLHGNAGLFLPS